MKWLDNVGWPKVVLLLGALIIVLGVVIFSPEARAWLTDMTNAGMELWRDTFGGLE